MVMMVGRRSAASPLVSFAEVLTGFLVFLVFVLFALSHWMASGATTTFVVLASRHGWDLPAKAATCSRAGWCYLWCLAALTIYRGIFVCREFLFAARCRLSRVPRLHRFFRTPTATSRPSMRYMPLRQGSGGGVSSNEFMAMSPILKLPDSLFTSTVSLRNPTPRPLKPNTSSTKLCRAD